MLIYISGGVSIKKLIKNPNSLREEIKKRKLPLSSNSVNSLLNSEIPLQNLYGVNNHFYLFIVFYFLYL